MPNDDSGYIPCVSMLDFKIRDNKLMLVAMCRSIDFGKKVYANMLALNKIQEKVANEIGTKVGPLIMYVVSAHIYDEDYKKVEEILDEINATS
jgi:thymidylate synthase